MTFHASGPTAWIWYLMLVCNFVIPWLTLWNRKWRRTPWVMFIVTLLVNVGMYFERFTIIPMTLAHQRLPFDWGEYSPRLCGYQPSPWARCAFSSCCTCWLRG